MANNPQVILSGRYQVVPRSIIFLINKDQVLLQKGSVEKKIYPGLYNGIGGHIERGEDILSGAVRELQEETGIRCPDLRLAGTIMIDVTLTEGILLFVFTGENVIGELKPSKEGTLHWINIEQLDQFGVVEDVPELLSHVIKHLETRQLFFGQYSYHTVCVRDSKWTWT